VNTTEVKQTRRSFALPLDIILALAAVYLIWSTTYLAVRIALTSFPPLLMIGARFLVAGLLLFSFLWLRGNKLPSAKQWAHATVVGILLLGGGMGGTSFAEQWVVSSVAAIAAATTPIWTALMFSATGEPLTRWEWAGIGTGFAGVILLSLDGNLRASPAGTLALLIAMLSWSTGSVLSRRLQLPPGPMGFAAEMLTGGSFLIVLGLLRGEQLSSSFTSQALWAWIYLVSFGSLIAFNAYMYLLSRVRPALATSYAFVNPVLALFLGVVLAHDNVTSFAYLAVLLILLGLAFIMFKRPTKTA